MERHAASPGDSCVLTEPAALRYSFIPLPSMCIDATVREGNVGMKLND
jgi:hypothetical protein